MRYRALDTGKMLQLGYLFCIKCCSMLQVISTLT